ncbi:MAG: hypothetical protein WKF74_02895 [Pyrinomonadaceae bacterium]
MSKTIQLLQAAFPKEIAEALVGAVSQAYDVTYAHYAPEYGHDAMTFGLMLYKSKVHFLKQLAEKNDWIKVVRCGACFRFEIGMYTLATHRVGDSMEADIASLFPGNKTAAPKLAERNKRQLQLQFMEDGSFEHDDSGCHDLILADVGNPSDGLCQLFLNIPSDVSPDGRVNQWSTTYLIWESNEAYGGIRHVHGVEQIPDETVAPPTITLKESEYVRVEQVAPPNLNLKQEDAADKKKRNESK